MSENRSGRASDVAVKDPACIRVGWTFAGGCVLVALLVLFNAFPERIGVIVSADDPSSFVPLLAPEFFEDLLLRLNVWWGLALALNVVNLYYDRWMWGTRLADYALTFFGMFILLKVIFSPILGVNPEWVQPGQPAVLVAERLVPLLTWLVKGGLAAALIATLVSLAVKLRSLHRMQRLASAQS